MTDDLHPVTVDLRGIARVQVNRHGYWSKRGLKTSKVMAGGRLLWITPTLEDGLHWFGARFVTDDLRIQG